MEMRRRAYEKALPYLRRGATKEKRAASRALRNDPTAAEVVLWGELRKRQIEDLSFRRQHIVAGYIIDFYCPSLRLAIEVDGEVHDSQQVRDSARDAALSKHGITTIRFRNEEVLSALPECIQHLRATIAARTPPSAFRREGGREG